LLEVIAVKQLFARLANPNLAFDGCYLGTFGSSLCHLGSLGAPFGSIWLHFGTIWTPFRPKVSCFAPAMAGRLLNKRSLLCFFSSFTWLCACTVRFLLRRSRVQALGKIYIYIYIIRTQSNDLWTCITFLRI